MKSEIRSLLLILLIFIPFTHNPDGDRIAQAQDAPPYRFVKITDHKFERLTDMAQMPDGPNRFVVVEKRGIVYVVQDGEVLSAPFLDLEPVVTSEEFEQGLLGFAFHPNYTENGYFYVNYTRFGDGDTLVARFKVSEKDPNRADPTSFTRILHIDQLSKAHNGGMLLFGPDGYLYIGVGDGSTKDDDLNQAQNTYTLLGSILRIDVDGNSDYGPYGIPPDNPFADGIEGRPEVYIYGLRNPWRFSFDMETNDLWIGDVGQGTYEEINWQPPEFGGGINYGWPAYEGFDQFPIRYDEVPIAWEDVHFPVSVYDHTDGCSVIGGYVYRGETMPELNGTYIYGDLCSAKLWSVRRNDQGVFITSPFMDTDIAVASFAQDSAGELYILDHYRGWVYKMVPTYGEEQQAE